MLTRWPLEALHADHDGRWLLPAATRPPGRANCIALELLECLLGVIRTWLCAIPSASAGSTSLVHLSALELPATLTNCVSHTLSVPTVPAGEAPASETCM